MPLVSSCSSLATTIAYIHHACWSFVKLSRFANAVIFLFCSGTRNSLDCTLILTEGDSAKTLAVAGLGVVGRDKYGVYPLRGKLLNVREATHKQVIS